MTAAGHDSGPQPRVNRQSIRTEATRKALLAAARKVFARDGYEAARIEDIAAEAGRSRGAFYANFANKEAAFFALREQAIAEYMAEIHRLQQARPPGPGQGEFSADWLTAHILEAGQLILQIEFKLYAIRHPESRRELMQQHIGRLGKSASACEPPTPEQRQRVLLIESIIEGLALNRSFSPELLTEDALHQAVQTLFGALLAPAGDRG